MKIIIYVCCLLFFSGTISFSEFHENKRTAIQPSLVSSLKISSSLDFCNENVPIQNQEIRERLEKELLISLWEQHQAILWIKRANRYFPIIEKMLKKEKMPDDIKYVAIIESALRPHVGSPKGAMGFWQFMEETGEKYGLRIDGYIDERRNIFASTRAAIKYYKNLYNDFGSWTLAAASYNMGEDGLRSEIIAQKVNNYYNLYLPLETQRYIFRIISAKMILSDPEKYGLFVGKEELYPPVKYDRIKIKCLKDTPIQMIAGSAKTTFKRIKDLNPEIRGHYIVKGTHVILIPKGASEGFAGRFKVRYKKWREKYSQCLYVVKKGDNLSIIADRYNVPLQTLYIWNRLNNKKHIYPGDRLIVCQKGLI